MLRANRTVIRLAVLPFVAHAAIGWTAELATLKSARQVRQLSPDQAALSYPVHLQLVVTFRNFLPHSIFAQDATAGIFVSCAQDCSGLDIGQQVSIDGISRPGKVCAYGSRGPLEGDRERLSASGPGGVPGRVIDRTNGRAMGSGSRNRADGNDGEGHRID